MLEKNAQQDEESALTKPFIHNSVTYKSATAQEKLQLSDHKETRITTFFLLAERALPTVTKYICLILATVNYVYTHDMLMTILIIGFAMGTLSAQEVIKMLIQYLQLRRLNNVPEGVFPVDMGVSLDELSDHSTRDSKE